MCGKHNKKELSAGEVEKGVNTCFLEAFMRELVFEVSSTEWVRIHWDWERHPRWNNRLNQVMESGKYKAFLKWCDGQFGRRKTYIWGTSLEDQAEEGKLRTRPWKALCASLSWLEMRNHWRFLSRTVVWLKVRPWKMNSGSCMYSCWERPILGRPVAKQRQWSRGEKMRIQTDIIG